MAAVLTSTSNLQTFAQIQSAVGSGQFKLMVAGTLQEASFNSADKGIYTTTSGTFLNFMQPPNIYLNQIAMCAAPANTAICLRHGYLLLWGHPFGEGSYDFAWKFYLQTDGTYLIGNDYNNPTYLGVTNGRLKIVAAGDSTIQNFYFCRSGYYVNTDNNGCVEACAADQILVGKACVGPKTIPSPAENVQASIQIPKDYTLSFVLRLNNYSSQTFSSITGISLLNAAADSVFSFGGRTPYVYLYRQKLHFSFGAWSTSNYNFGGVTAKVIPLNADTRVHIVAVGNNYEVRLNHTRDWVGYTTNPRPSGLARWIIGGAGTIGVSTANGTLSELRLIEGNASITDCDYVVDAWASMSGASNVFPAKSSVASYCCGSNGVECEDDKVIKIAWNDKSLSGRISMSLTNLNSLKHL